RDALGKGREDLARAALQTKSQLLPQYSDLETQFANLQEQEEKLTLASQRLDAKVQSFRTRKETLKATYNAAKAQTRINEALSWISEEMGDVGLAIQRAEDKTAQMQARAGAIDELLASGALEDHVGGGQDYIQAELDKLGASSGVDSELEAMKREIASSAPKQIEGNGVGPADQQATAAEQQAGD